MIFIPCLSMFLSLFLCHLLSFFRVLCGFSMSLCAPLNPSFSLLYSSFFTPRWKEENFISLFHIPFLSGYCRLDLRHETCEFKDLYFWRNCRHSNLLSNNNNLAIFGPLKLEIRAITQDSSSGLIQSLLFYLLFRLWNCKTEFYALYMFCRPSSQIFENGDKCLELSCIASFAAQNQSMFGFAAGFCLLSNLVSENTLISHEVNSSKRDPKF